jgi:hypothetical protein
MATKETERTETDKQASQPFRVRLPGFIVQDQVGLGDVIKRATYVMGFTLCAACEKRVAWLNRSVIFTR